MYTIILFMFFVGCVTVSDVMGGDGAARGGPSAAFGAAPGYTPSAAPMSTQELQMMMMQQQMMIQQQQAQQLAQLALAKSGQVGEGNHSAAQPGSHEPVLEKAQTVSAQRFTLRGDDSNLELLFDGSRLPQYISDSLVKLTTSGQSGLSLPRVLDDLNKESRGFRMVTWQSSSAF